MDKKAIEKLAGFEIPDPLYEKSVTAAKRKLQFIIQQHGDADGVRRTPGYLAELVIEALKSELLTEYTINRALSGR